MHAVAKWLLVMVVATIPVILMLVLPDSGGTLPVASTASQQDIIHFSKRIILTSVRSPETAVFPDDSQFQIQQLAPNEWRVSAYVDAESGVGKTNRTPWTIEVQQNGTRWVMTKREQEKSALTENVTKGSWTSRLKK